MESSGSPEHGGQSGEGATTLFPGNVAITGPAPWLDVTAWGAAGDGATDDTNAIQTAMNAVPPDGGTVFILPGEYVVSAPLLLRAGVRSSAPGNEPACCAHPTTVTACA